jgi:hypothetical protein
MEFIIQKIQIHNNVAIFLNPDNKIMLFQAIMTPY